MGSAGATIDVESRIGPIGAELAERFPDPGRTPAAALERRVMNTMMADEQLRAALFRFVDVRPACSSRADVRRHLSELLGTAEGSALADRLARLTDAGVLTLPTALVATAGVRQMAHRFIAGSDADDALGELRRLWRDGVASSVDLLGEATLTEAEADAYAGRCEGVLRAVAGAASGWPERPLLEHDGAGRLARANLSVKVSALTPELRANAPARGAAGARERLRHLLRVARDLGAHLHVDMEAFDTYESVTALVLELLAEDEFAEGPSAGMVIQAYLTASGDHLDRLIEWSRAHPRGAPLAIRLVKGAYWDQEVAEAAQKGWAPPVFTERSGSDQQFELLSKRLLDAFPLVRVAIASHNLRSISHAIAYADAIGLDESAIELQVLRGLGDETGSAIAATGRRVRSYCPVGDLVAGMAYLVRRLLENTANDSFLADHASGIDLDRLLEAPS